MESQVGCRRRRLAAQPPRRSHRLSRGGDGDGVDRISGLNDDLLMQVLVRLPCARAAVRTSVLSRRWRDLWKHLPELSFRGIAPAAVDSALAMVAIPKLSLLDIYIPDYNRFCSVEGIASLLRAAALHDPVELDITAYSYLDPMYDPPIAIKMPSFARAKSMRLCVNRLHLTLPAQGGGFPVLERLSIAGCLDTGALISRCPHLRVLELTGCSKLETIKVHSETIEELIVIDQHRLRGVDVVASMLKKFTLQGSVCDDFSMSLLAPKVENLSWDCRCWYRDPNIVWIDVTTMWYLDNLMLWTVEDGFVLGLELNRPYSVTHTRNLKEMFKLPNISVLELSVDACGHVYGATVLTLLRICNTIKRLKLVTDHHHHRASWRTDEACPPDCPCNQPQNWRSQNIALMSLEKVEIVNFKGRGHEVDFVKLLFRCAPPLMNVTLRLASKVVPSSRGCKETYNIFKANPAAECHVYRKRGREIIYV